MIHITVTDPATGDTQTAEIHDDYVIICDGRAYVDGLQVHGNGTTVITVKKATESAKSEGGDDE